MDINIKNYYLFLKNLDYKLVKSEVWFNGPSIRQVDDVFLFYDELNSNVELLFCVKNIYHAANVFETILQDLILKYKKENVIYFELKFEKIEINDKNMIIEERNTFYDLNFIFNNISQGDNKIKIKLKNNEIFYQEASNILYKVYKNYPDSYFLDKELDFWENEKG